jgi:hypothetical protein
VLLAKKPNLCPNWLDTSPLTIQSAFSLAAAAVVVFDLLLFGVDFVDSFLSRCVVS